MSNYQVFLICFLCAIVSLATIISGSAGFCGSVIGSAISLYLWWGRDSPHK